MEFVLERERLEAQRRLIEAEGIRDSQLVVAESVDDKLLQWNAIQAFKELATSPNAKVIVTDGASPFLLEASDASP